ncbi:RhoGAP domain protein [Ostertagia ostertagi]
MLDADLAPAAEQTGLEDDSFGAVLASLVDEDHIIPPLVDRLFMNVETKIVRRNVVLMGPCFSSDELLDFDSVSLEDVQVHVLTTLVKAFLREMPEPLITFDLYENFLNVSEVDDGMERGRCLAVMIDLLPKTEPWPARSVNVPLSQSGSSAVNKMGPSNLALIFGPCILRRQDNVHAQEQLNDVTRQAICVQTLIEEKLRQYKATLINIVELEDASQKVRQIASNREASTQWTNGVEELNSQASRDTTEFLARTSNGSPAKKLPRLAPVACFEDLSSGRQHSQVLPGRNMRLTWMHHLYSECSTTHANTEHLLRRADDTRQGFDVLRLVVF